MQESDFGNLGYLGRRLRLYLISVRRTSVLPAASFRFHLAMDTLAVRLTIPPVGFVGLSLPSKSALPGAPKRKPVKFNFTGRQKKAVSCSPDVEVVRK